MRELGFDSTSGEVSGEGPWNYNKDMGSNLNMEKDNFKFRPCSCLRLEIIQGTAAAMSSSASSN